MKASFGTTSAANDEASEFLTNPTGSSLKEADSRASIERTFLRKKITLPVIDERYIHRERFDSFIEKICSSRLSIVQAPAGYGKTSLLSHWLNNEPKLSSRYAWLTLDSRDNDIFRLCYYLIESLSSLLSEAAKAELYNLIDYSNYLWSEWESEKLVIELAEKLESIDGTVMIVLDNFQLIQSDQIKSFIDTLLIHAPENLSLVVLSSQPSGLSTTKLRLDRQLTEITTKELQFSETESIRLLDGLLPNAIEQEVKTELLQRSEGWGAGLHLLSLALQCKDLQSEVVLPSSIRYVTEYFSNEVLNILSEEELQYLCQLSVLEYWCADLCKQLLNNSIEDNWLEGIAQKLGFIEQLNDKGPWYRPHPMLRQALADLGKLGAHTLQGIYSEASLWFEAREMISDAIEYAIRAGDSNRVLPLILKLSNVSLLDQNMATLLKMREKILRQGGHASGRLSIVYMWILMACSRIHEAEAYIQQYLTEMDEQNSEIVAELLAVKAFIAKAKGNIALAGSLAREALDGLRVDRVSVRLICHLIVSNSLSLEGRFDDAKKANRDAVLLSREPGDIKLEMLGLYDAARIELSRGYLNRVSTLVKQGLELSGASLCDLNSIAESRLRVYWALVKMHQGKLMEAERLVNSTIREAERSNDIGALLSYVIKAILHKGAGDIDQAFAVIGRAERFINVWQIDDVSYRQTLNVSKLMLWIEQGNFERATLALSEIKALQHSGVVADLFPLLPGVLDLLEIRLLVKTGETVGALERLTELQRIENNRASNSVTSIYILIYQAIIYSKGRKPDRALMAIRSAIQKAEVENWLSPFWDLAQEIRPLITEIISASETNDFLVDLANLCNVGSQSGGQVAEVVLEEPISDREMGVLELIAQGLSNQDIADKLYISLHTVKTHARRINNKLGVKSRTQAIVKARQFGLL